MTEEETVPKFPWIDPENHPVNKDNHYYAVKNETSHKSVAIIKPLHSKGLEKIDDFDWELFHSSHRGTVNNVEYIWGSFVEGIGMFNVMVAMENARRLTPQEIETFSNKRYGMYGSHSGNLSYTFGLGKID